MSSDSTDISLDEIPHAGIAADLSKRNNIAKIKQTQEYRDVMQKISVAIRSGECEASDLGTRMSDALFDLLESMEYEVETDKYGWKVTW